MRVAAITMVKNECDIIELFIRINARVCDHFFILDDASSDATVEILKRLRADGFPITLWPCESLSYQQADITNAALRKVSLLDFDWILPIDADELVASPHLRDELATLPASVYGKLMWQTFVPVQAELEVRKAPLFSGFRARARESMPFGKVALSRQMAARAVLHLGNHEAYERSGRQLPAQVLATRLAHVPVRSAPQIITKVLIGSHKNSIKKHRRGKELFHWTMMAEHIRRLGYRLDADELKRMALMYCIPAGMELDLSLDEGPRVGTEQDVLVYGELARIDAAERFDAFATSLCQAIRGRPNARLERVREVSADLAFRARRRLGV